MNGDDSIRKKNKVEIQRRGYLRVDVGCVWSAILAAYSKTVVRFFLPNVSMSQYACNTMPRFIVESQNLPLVACGSLALISLQDSAARSLTDPSGTVVSIKTNCCYPFVLDLVCIAGLLTVNKFPSVRLLRAIFLSYDFSPWTLLNLEKFSVLFVCKTRVLTDWCMSRKSPAAYCCYRDFLVPFLYLELFPSTEPRFVFSRVFLDLTH